MLAAIAAVTSPTHRHRAALLTPRRMLRCYGCAKEESDGADPPPPKLLQEF